MCKVALIINYNINSAKCRDIPDVYKQADSCVLGRSCPWQKHCTLGQVDLVEWHFVTARPVKGRPTRVEVMARASSGLMGWDELHKKESYCWEMDTSRIGWGIHISILSSQTWYYAIGSRLLP